MKKKYFILSFIILVYIILFIISASKQGYYGDEVIFIEAAREIASGNPIGHFGYIDGKINQDRSSMLMHPPTYIYLISLSIYFFGENSYSVRMISAIFTIGIILLIYLITKNLLKDKDIKNSEFWALFSAFIYAISPFVIQSSILVDIDGGLLLFSIMLFFYLYIKKSSSIYLFLSLLLIFSSKMIGPIMVFASLFLINLLCKDYRELKRITLLFFAAGTYFFVFFFLYTKLIGLNWDILFTHNSISGAILGLLAYPSTTLLKSLWGFKVFYYFLTPFVIFIFLILSFKVIKNLIISLVNKNDYIIQNKNMILLWIYSLVTILFFLIIVSNATWNFPKYYIISVPAIFILITFWTSEKNIDVKKILPIFILTVLILYIYFFFFFGDPLIPELKERFATTSISAVLIPVLIRNLLYVIIPLIISIGLFIKIPKEKLWIILLFLAISTFLYIDIVQIRADYSTVNIYGDRGLNQVLDFVKDKSPSEIICYPHVGYYLDYLKIHEITTLYNNKTKFLNTINNEHIKWIILYQKDIKLLGEDSFKDFKLDKEFGDYKILSANTGEN